MRRRGASRSPENATGDADSARLAALAHLARRDFSSGELRQRLETGGFDAASAAAAIAGLAREGILDDARFAQNYVASRAGRGQGPVRIRAELRRHGLADALIEGALASGPDWGALALKVRRARFGPAAPVTWANKARQARFLQYRGFSSDDIRAATDADFEQD